MENKFNDSINSILIEILRIPEIRNEIKKISIEKNEELNFVEKKEDGKFMDKNEQSSEEVDYGLNEKHWFEMNKRIDLLVEEQKKSNEIISLKILESIKLMIDESNKKIDEFKGDCQTLENKVLSIEKNVCNGISSIIESRIQDFQKSEINKINNEFNKVKDENVELTKKIFDLEKYNISINQELETTNKKYKLYEEIINTYENIKQLDDDTKSYLERLCGSTNIYSYLSLGRDLNKLGHFWLYLKECAISSTGKNIKLDKLNQYFEFCVNVANSCKNQEEQFEFYGVEEGSDFNRDLCIKTSTSNQIGVVTQLITKGIKIKNKIIYQCIVEIG